MIFYQHFRELIEDTTSDLKLSKPEFTLACSMLVAHESQGGKFLRQHPTGPALGVIQMERATHADTWLHCDNIQMYAERLGYREDVNKLKYDLRYNIFMARMRFIMDVNPFPKTEKEMAVYLKNYWNSKNGAASPEKYLQDYYNWIEG